MAIIKEKVLLLYHGQRLSRDEFLQRWEAMPYLQSGELIGGVVYMPSPVSTEHGDSDFGVATWQGVYAAHTPGVVGNSKSAWLMLEDSPQPESSLRVLPDCGGHSRPEGKYLAGAPELLTEVSLSSEHYDLHEKLELYERAGVDEYLVVLPASHEIRWHRLIKGTYQLLTPAADGIMRSIVLPGLWLNPQALLTRDMAQVLATLQQGLQSPEHAAFVQELQRRRAATLA